MQLLLKEDALGLALNRFCATGRGGGVDPSCGAGSAAQGDGGLPKPALVPIPPSLPGKVLAKVGAGAKVLRAKAKELYDKLEARYGKKGAAAIFASGQAISWGAFAVGAAAGTVVYIPSAVAMAPGAAIAEIARLVNRGKGVRNFDVQAEALKLIQELTDFWRPYAAVAPDAPVENVRWAFEEPGSQVQMFRDWLKLRVTQLVGGHDFQGEWHRQMANAYAKGARRSASEVLGSDAIYNESVKALSLKQKAKLLAQRSFTDLEGVTDRMSTRMAGLLADGLTAGDSPKAIAKALAAEVDLSMSRALIVARTEITRAHAQGQLLALKESGVDKVGVEVEWRAAQDDRVCELCSSMDGVTFSIEEADGLIPAHPNCRCAFIPAV